MVADKLNADAEAMQKRSSSAPELERFALRLKEAMGGTGIRAFGKKCGLSEGALFSYLSGHTFPTLDRLAAIATTVNRPMSWFLGEDVPSQSVGLDEGTLAQAVGLLQGLLVGRGTLSPGDFATALIGLYQVCSPGQSREALASKVVEISAFVARRAQGA